MIPRSSSGPGTNTSSTLTPGGNASGGMSPYTNRIADAQCLPANHSPRPVHKNGIDMSSNKVTISLHLSFQSNFGFIYYHVFFPHIFVKIQ